MDETLLQDTLSFIGKYTNFIIAIPVNATIDSTTAALALAHSLEVLGKQARVVSAGPVSGRLSFLEEVKKITPLTESSVELTVLLNTQEAELGELSYKQLPGQVQIFLRPKKGLFKKEDVTVESSGGYAYDALITVAVERLEDLGETFSMHTELFYSLPRLNLDISAQNDLHGTTNVVAVTESSMCELVYHIISALSEAEVPTVATILLAGMLSATNSLKNNKTTPRSFAAVADLTAAGADYNKVVKYLFKNESLGYLKLWGRCLARLTPVEGKSIAYAILQPGDLERTGEQPETVVNVVADLGVNVSEFKNIAILAPTPTNFLVVVTLHPQFIVKNFLSELEVLDFEVRKLDSGGNLLVAHIKSGDGSIEPVLVRSLVRAVVG